MSTSNAPCAIDPTALWCDLPDMTSRRGLPTQGRRDYPDEPEKPLDTWQKRIQWAMHHRQMSRRKLTSEISEEATGQGMVGHWLSGKVDNPSLAKLLKAAQILGVNPRWILFNEAKPYAREPAQLPPELEQALLHTKPTPSDVVIEGVTAFFARHQDAHLSEQDWLKVRREFEEAERRSMGVLDFVAMVHVVSNFESRVARNVEPAQGVDVAPESSDVPAAPIGLAKASKPAEPRRRR